MSFVPTTSRPFARSSWGGNADWRGALSLPGPLNGVNAQAPQTLMGGQWGQIGTVVYRSKGITTNNYLSGVTRDSTGAILGSCRVEIFATGNDAPLGNTVSRSTDGAFAFANPGPAPFYLVAYKPGSPDVAGTTVNTLTANSGVGVQFVVSFAGASLPSGTTLTRASSGDRFNSSGTLVAETTDAARFDYNPDGLALRGLLVEPARTNKVVQSNGFSNAAWTIGGATVTSASATSPDGTNNGWLLQVTSSGGPGVSSNLRPGIGTSSGDSISIYAKRGTTNFLSMSNDTSAGNSWAYFDLLAGCVPTFNNCTPTIVYVGNGWYRCAMQNVGSGPFILLTPVTYPVNGTPWTSGFTTAGNNVYIYEEQAEAAATVSTTISTGAATVTRSADVVSFTIPAGVSQLVYTFGNGQTQTVSAVPGAYTIPTTLSQAAILSIVGT